MIEITAKIHDSVIKETLNRIGIAIEDGDRKRLFPSVYLYITEINGERKKFLIHFKEYYQITRGSDAYNNISEEDMNRLGYIAGLLRRWGVIECDPRSIVKWAESVRVLSKKESSEWNIIHKIKF